MAECNDEGMVKYINIGKSAAKYLSDKVNVQRLVKVILIMRQNYHENR